MTISDDIQAIREKYTPDYLKGKPKYDPSTYCKNEYARSLGQCQTCGVCGREFDENGRMIKDIEQ